MAGLPEPTVTHKQIGERGAEDPFTHSDEFNLWERHLNNSNSVTQF